MQNYSGASRALLTAALTIILVANFGATAQAGDPAKIDNKPIAQKPTPLDDAANEAPIPGTRGSLTEAHGAYMYVLPQMLKTIAGADDITAAFGWGNKSPQPLTEMLDQLLITQPQAKPALEEILRKHKYFKSLRDWAQTGDEFTLGMMGATMKRDNPAYYNRIFTLTAAELRGASDQLRPTYEYLRGLSDEEQLYYDSYLDYYLELVGHYTTKP